MGDPRVLVVRGKKDIWDAFQNFPKRKALFFFADVVEREWRADC